MASNKAKIITVTSVKGGTGKSVIALSIAGILKEQELKTVIVDLDLSSGVIAASLNIKPTQDIYSLVDDMMNNRYDQIEKYITSYDENIDILAAPNDPRNTLKIYPQYIDNIIKQLEYKYDIIVIDTNHITSEINLITFDLSTEILYVITDDLMDLKNMKTMLSIYEDMEVDKYKLILNESISRNLTNFEIKTVLGKEIDYTLPKAFREENIQKLIMDGKILTLEKPNNKGTNIIREIVKDIIK
ncbi:MAG: P-loop NTPase [Bacilli bacterium]|nr:P-loop NTPase [Bacilli bacterium]